MKGYAIPLFLCVLPGFVLPVNGKSLIPPSEPIMSTPGPEPRIPIESLPGSMTA